jgi:hypothetical protein
MNAIADVTGEHARVRAHGYGAGGAGVALGGLGADGYLIRAFSTATAIATSLGGTTNLATATARSGNADSLGQGLANTGAGVLADPGGNDLYSVLETSSATAIRNGAPGTAIPGLLLWGGRGAAPGVGLGALIDLGGFDSYSPVYGPMTPGGNELCWTNAPPGLPGNLNVGIGVDVFSAGPGGLPGTCTLPLPPN